CHACTVACKSEHEVAVGVNRTWVKYIEKGQFPHSRRLFSVMRCNHCDDAPCVEICPVTALFRRDDGIVDFDNRRCIGCKACMQACPYDALYIDPNTHTAAKCNYCAHRIDKGLEPACVIVCPTQAIVSGDLDDPDSHIAQLKSREAVSVRKPEKATRPALYYIEGDRASLDPSAAPPIDSSMWGQQNAGVGHYAKYIEERVAQQTEASNGKHPLDQLRHLLDLGDRGDGVLNPDKDNPAMTASADAVQSEVTRRAYDAPNKGVLWGWQVSAYVWTKAISSGVALVAAMAAASGLAVVTGGTQWLTLIVSLMFLAITGALLTMDLDQPKRFLYVLLRPQWKSWLVRGAWIISAFGLALLAWAIAAITTTNQPPAWVFWFTAVTAALTAVYTAFLFAQAKGRDFWQSPLLAVHMLVHAIIAGAALFALFLPFFDELSWRAFVVQTLVVSLFAKLAIDWFELAMTHTTADGKRVARMITRGEYARLYWPGVVIMGCLIPLTLLLTTPWWTSPLAGLLALAGLYIAEHIWVRAPQQLPLG
ncbi:MAG: 4Fe-4S dicluster domain-containing protein, partial [Pirellulaceae bacterium]